MSGIPSNDQQPLAFISHALDEGSHQQRVDGVCPWGFGLGRQAGKHRESFRGYYIFKILLKIRRRCV
jgi:hypothetical protein